MENVSKQHALRALVESIITPGIFLPTESFLTGTSVAVTMDGKPIVVAGPADDQESIETVDLLLASKEFAALVKYEFGDYKELSKAVVPNKDVVQAGQEYKALTKKDQGIGVEGGTGQLAALIPHGSNAFGFGICVSNELMLCFYPHATPLTDDITLDV